MQELLAQIQEVYGLEKAPRLTPFQCPDWGVDENSNIRVSPWDIDHYSPDKRLELVEEWMKRGWVTDEGYITLTPNDKYFHKGVTYDLFTEDEYTDEDAYYDQEYAAHLDTLL